MQQMRMIVTIIFLFLVSMGDIKTKKVSLKTSCIFIGLAILIHLLEILHPAMVEDTSSTGSIPISIAISNMAPVWSMIFRIISGLLPGVLVLILGFFTRWKLGPGDGIVIMVLGVLLGQERTIVILLYALFFCGIFSGVLLAAKKVRKTTTLPFIPFLGLGYLVTCVLQSLP